MATRSIPPQGGGEQLQVVPLRGQVGGHTTQAPSTPSTWQGVQGEAKPYTRGSATAAMEAAANPSACRDFLWEAATASTTRGPTKSRQNLWAGQAGFSEPFLLTPDLIYVVMGALKSAQYRSADQYLEAAKALHVANGYPWTDQLAQARRTAIHSCRRHLGHPKQAGGLPLLRLGPLAHRVAQLTPGGPTWPARSTLLASWWLLREIEAASTHPGGPCGAESHLAVAVVQDGPGSPRRIPISPVRLCILSANGVSVPSHGGAP